MMTKMMLAGLLAFAAVPALGADTTFDRQAAAVTSADVVHAQGGKQVAGMSHARACTCMQRGS